MTYSLRSPRATITALDGGPAPSGFSGDTGGVITLTDGVRPPRSLGPLEDAPRARERLQAIQAKSDASLDTWPTTARLTEAVQNARGDLGAYRERHGDAASPGEIARLQAEIERTEKALAEHRAATAALKAAGRRWQATNSDVVKCINSATVSGFTLIDKVVDVPAGADQRMLAQRLGEIVAQVQEVQEAPVPFETAVAQVRQRIERQAEAGAPRASVDVELSGPHLRAKMRSVVNLHWPTRTLPAAPVFDNGEPPDVIDTEGVLCWAFRDAIMAKVEEDLTAFYRAYSGPVYAPEDQRERLRELAAERLTTQRELAELIWRAIDAGDVAAVFPQDMSPLAILGVEEVRKKR